MSPFSKRASCLDLLAPVRSKSDLTNVLVLLAFSLIVFCLNHLDSLPLRRAMGGLISLIARLTLPMDEWPEFWPAMFQLANSEYPSHRESLLQVIEELGDKIFDYIKPQMTHLVEFCGACMAADQPPEMRVAAMKAFGVLAGEVDDDHDELVPSMQPLVMSTLEVIMMCVQEGADYEARDGLNIFQSMIRLCPSIVAPHVLDISQFCLVSMTNADQIDWEVRLECLGFVEEVVKLRPSYLSKHGMLDPLFGAVFQIATEPQVDGLAPWTFTPHRYALQVIDSIAKSVKPKHVFDNVMARVDNWMGSENPWERRAAVGALSALPGGCPEQMLPNLEAFMPYLQAAFADPDHYVRQAGCVLLAQFADCLSPDILDYHEICLPLAYNALCEENEEVQDRALYALVTFLEDLDTDRLTHILDELIRRLVHILETSQSKDLQEMTIECIGAVATAALDKFLPYWEPVIKIMQQLMEITSADLMTLRAHALRCAGVIAMAVGKEVFHPYFDFFMNKSLESFNLSGAEATQMREFSIVFFGDVAEALGTDFAPYFDTVLQLLFESLENVDGAQPELGEENAAMAQLMVDSDDEKDQEIKFPTGDPDDVGLDEEDALQPELQGLKYITNQGLVDEKVTALQSLGTIAYAMQHLYYPHINRTIEVLATTARYVHPRVRTFTVYPLEACANCLHIACPPAAPYLNGSGEDPALYPLSPDAQQFVDDLVGIFCKRILNDIDLSVVARYVESLKVLMNSLGAPSIHHHIGPLIGPTLLGVMQNKTVAHVMSAEEGDDENEMIQQELITVFDMCCNFIIDLAKAYGPLFVQWFEILQGVILNLTVNDDQPEVAPAEDGMLIWRQEAIGCLAEVCDAAGITCFGPDHINILLARAVRGLKEVAVNLQCNSMYLTRLIVGSPHSYNFYPHLLPLILPHLAAEDDQLADNANGAIANMIVTNPAGVPLEEVIPEWLSAFPIRIDQIESNVAYGALITLLGAASQDIFPHIPTAFQILLDSISSPVITEEMRTRVGETVKALWAQFSSDLQGTLETLDEETLHNAQSLLGL